MSELIYGPVLNFDGLLVYGFGVWEVLITVLVIGFAIYVGE